MTKIIDGKKIAQEIKEEIKKEADILQKSKKIKPGLAVILMGEDPASQIYVKNKKKACLELGFASFEYKLKAGQSEDELITLIKKLNKNKKIHGILIQLPLPKHIKSENVLASIDPQKDVDGFHPLNIGKMFLGQADFPPCTPAGIIELLNRSNIKIIGQHAVVLGRSNIVGKPVSLLLQQAGATVTMCHSQTSFLTHHTKMADILVTAVGQAGIIKSNMVKQGVVVIDVGINRLDSGLLVGDVDFENVKKIAQAITPVPGGVGPMTIAMLMKNCLRAAKMEDPKANIT